MADKGGREIAGMGLEPKKCILKKRWVSNWPVFELVANRGGIYVQPLLLSTLWSHRENAKQNLHAAIPIQAPGHNGTFRNNTEPAEKETAGTCIPARL